MKICVEPGCFKKAAKDRKRCSKHESAYRRSLNPMRYSYHTLKDNAKRRGKSFTLSFEEFRRFALETNYIAGKGRSKQSYSIDRIDNDKGYEPDNIRVLSLADNSKKYNKKLCYDWRSKTAIVITDQKINSQNNPF